MSTLDKSVKEEFKLLFEALDSAFRDLSNEMGKRDMALLRLVADNPHMKADELVEKYRTLFPHPSLTIDLKRTMGQLGNSGL